MQECWLVDWLVMFTICLIGARLVGGVSSLLFVVVAPKNVRGEGGE